VAGCVRAALLAQQWCALTAHGKCVLERYNRRLRCLWLTHGISHNTGPTHAHKRDRCRSQLVGRQRCQGHGALQTGAVAGAHTNIRGATQCQSFVRKQARTACAWQRCRQTVSSLGEVTVCTADNGPMNPVRHRRALTSCLA